MHRYGLRFRAAFTMLAVIVGLSLAGPVPASDGPAIIDSSQAETSDLWFVELESPPLAAGGRKQNIQRDKRNFRNAAAAAGIQFQERFAFDTLWNGLSIQIEPDQVPALTLLRGVTAVYPVGMVDAPPAPEEGVKPDLFTALGMTGADVAHNVLGLTGEGVRVGIIDTGIDYNHPDLGGCFGPGCKVEFGFDFVGDDFPSVPPAPDDDPLDCNGHGTHVAGIVGAEAAGPDGVTGVAPGVTLGAYRVFGCTGSTSSDIIIAAMERALADGMDVINMSLGAAFQWPQHPTAQASNVLVDAGVTVVASTGNNGASGVYSAGSPGVGEKVIAVASVDNEQLELNVLRVAGVDIGYGVMGFAADPPTSGTEEIVFIGRACVASQGDELAADPEGKIALAVRGACTFREKAEAAVAAGAIAVVIHNNAPGFFFGTLGEPEFGTPVVSISGDDGLFIRGLPEPVELTWTDETAFFPVPSAGLISGFSSYGHAPDLSLKPDISAPGGFIFSTWLEGEYATLSGTSMSAPHVAGSVALLLQARPDTSAEDVRGILQNSADPIAFVAGSPFLQVVHRQGAGLLDIPGAVQSTTSIHPGKLELGEVAVGAPVVRTLTVENADGDPVTYNLSHAPALITAFSTFAPSFFNAPATVSLPASVEVPANGSVTFDVEIAYPFTAPNLQFGGYVVFTSQTDGTTFRVPYAGFAGDYQALVALAPGTFGFPWLAKLEDGFFFNQPDGANFTMKGDDIAWILFHLQHQVSLLKAEIVPLREVGDARELTLFEIPFFGRNSSPGAFFSFAWDGSALVNGRVTSLPMGDYRIRITILKALGDPGNPAHFETWDSPVITIDRRNSRARG